MSLRNQGLTSPCPDCLLVRCNLHMRKNCEGPSAVSLSAARSWHRKWMVAEQRLKVAKSELRSARHLGSAPSEKLKKLKARFLTWALDEVRRAQADVAKKKDAFAHCAVDVLIGEHR